MSLCQPSFQVLTRGFIKPSLLLMQVFFYCFHWPDKQRSTFGKSTEWQCSIFIEHFRLRSQNKKLCFNEIPEMIITWTSRLLGWETFVYRCKCVKTILFDSSYLPVVMEVLKKLIFYSLYMKWIFKYKTLHMSYL